MKANEFRIGNWIHLYSADTNSNVCITGILDWKIIFGLRDSQIENEEISGIPLTEEWLLKFGFTKNENRQYEIEIHRQGLILASDLDGEFSLLLYRYDIGCNSNVLIFISFIHQLQNLCFALTGEELTIKQNG